MGFFRFFDPPEMPAEEWRIVKPQHVLVSEGCGWQQRVLHKGSDGSLWVHGFCDLEWLELDPGGSVKEANPSHEPRRWRDMPTMLDQPFVTIRQEA